MSDEYAFSLVIYGRFLGLDFDYFTVMNQINVGVLCCILEIDLFPL